MYKRKVPNNNVLNKNRIIKKQKPIKGRNNKWKYEVNEWNKNNNLLSYENHEKLLQIIQKNNKSNNNNVIITNGVKVKNNNSNNNNNVITNGVKVKNNKSNNNNVIITNGVKVKNNNSNNNENMTKIRRFPKYTNEGRYNIFSNGMKIKDLIQEYKNTGYIKNRKKGRIAQMYENKTIENIKHKLDIYLRGRLQKKIIYKNGCACISCAKPKWTSDKQTKDLTRAHLYSYDFKNIISNLVNKYKTPSKKSSNKYDLNRTDELMAEFWRKHSIILKEFICGTNMPIVATVPLCTQCHDHANAYKFSKKQISEIWLNVVINIFFPDVEEREKMLKKLESAKKISDIKNNKFQHYVSQIWGFVENFQNFTIEKVPKIKKRLKKLIN